MPRRASAPIPGRSASIAAPAPTRWNGSNAGWSLVGLLVLIAAIGLLFTGSYPKPIYDFVMGLDRWALRVGPYVALMTDRYPPFRLDMGGTDPGWVPAGPVPPPPSGASTTGPPAPVPAAR